MTRHSRDHAHGIASKHCYRYVRIGSTRRVPGYLPGRKQPALIIEFQVPEPAPDALVRDFGEIAAQAGMPPGGEALRGFTRWPLLQAMLGLAWVLLQRAGWPLLDPLAQLQHRTAAPGVVVAAMFPSLQGGERAIVALVEQLLDLAHQAADARPDATVLFATCVERLRKFSPSGMNSLRFLEAAHAQDIPWKRVAGNVYQFGWGANARWLDSSFTDETAYISMQFARNKYVTASILRGAGLPVPRHALAANASQAVAIAEQLGYPVVVKPANLDGGAGVAAYLDDANAVVNAFAQAAQLSSRVLVEKHVAGNDYRLQVFKGEVYWVTQRIPAGVTGDGINTVRALVAATNADPRRGGPGSRGLKQVMLDAEADAWLARQALTLDAVPSAGLYVRLRGAANVASGGSIVPVLESAHPDNLALAARAAQLLRLDLAGIDLLMPDIGRSWLEGGAAICEVNAQPQMASQLPTQLLPRLVRAQGRIPLLFMIGGTAADRAALFATAQAPGLGLATGEGAWVGGKQVAAAPRHSFAACMALIDDPAVTTLVLHVEDAAMLRTGCPVDRIDHLVLAGPLPDAAGATPWPATLSLARQLAMHSRVVWRTDTAPQWSGHGLPEASMPLQHVLAQALPACPA